MAFPCTELLRYGIIGSVGEWKFSSLLTLGAYTVTQKELFSLHAELLQMCCRQASSLLNLVEAIIYLNTMKVVFCSSWQFAATDLSVWSRSSTNCSWRWNYSYQCSFGVTGGFLSDRRSELHGVGRHRCQSKSVPVRQQFCHPACPARVSSRW